METLMILNQLSRDVGEMRGELKQYAIAVNRRLDEGEDKADEHEKDIGSLKRTRTYWIGYTTGAVGVLSILFHILLKVFH